MRSAIIAAMLLWLAGCTPAAPKPAPVGSPPSADRISLSPAITETVALLGAESRLKGRSDWCNEPPSVRALPAFGTSLTPALERIASAHPARLLIDGSLGNQRDQLEALAPVEVLPWLTVEEVMASTLRIGRLVDRDAAAAQLAERFRPWLRPLPAEAHAVLLLIGGRYHYFDATTCHRAIQNFVVQCGDPTATGRGGPGYEFDDELANIEAYQIGSVAMANAGASTNGSQFFIITGDDGAALPPRYTLFGQVSTDDMAIVQALNSLSNPQDGPPLEPIDILSVTIEMS